MISVQKPSEALSFFLSVNAGVFSYIAFKILLLFCEHFELYTIEKLGLRMVDVKVPVVNYSVMPSLKDRI